ncbi:MAG: hypothetical protein QG666_520, partial [Euryarchaeota archaeon]|nr:hypothetical protein [Euryarchaeota archaeon]
WVYKGFALEDLERYDESLICFDRAIEIDPQAANAWLGRSLIFLDLGREDERDKAFAMASKLGYHASALG